MNHSHCSILHTLCSKIENIKYWLRSYSHYRYACSVPDLETDTVVVTGGVYTQTIVSRYGKEGWIGDFSLELKYGRYDHGCASFLSKDNERVKLDLNTNNPTTN